MKHAFFLLSFVAVAIAHAVTSEPITPQSYALSFPEKILPSGAKVISVDLEVDQAEAIRVRSLPDGWITSTVRPPRTKFGVSIQLFNWGKYRGSPLALEELDDRFWIKAVIDEDDKPRSPNIQIWVSYVLPGKAEIKTMQVKPESVRLTYIP